MNKNQDYKSQEAIVIGKFLGIIIAVPLGFLLLFFINRSTEKEDERAFAQEMVLTPSQPKLHPPYSDSLRIKVNGKILTMVLVKGGTFLMGSTPEQRENPVLNELPVHEVTLPDYYISKHEITRHTYYSIMENKGSSQRPVTVSWNEAWAFIRKLNERTGLNFSLPTEAQWEYAARGGHLSRGYRYSGSDTLDHVAVYGIKHQRVDDKSVPVGSKKPNELGIFDMSGNVWEWCYDHFKTYYYSNSPEFNPTGPDFPNRKKSRDIKYVARGGYFGSKNPDACRVSKREGRFDNLFHPYVGIRLVLQLPPQDSLKNTNTSICSVL